MLVGGTGFYLRAIARGLAVDELPWDPQIRLELDELLAKEGLSTLVKELRRLAPTRAAVIDLHNSTARGPGPRDRPNPRRRATSGAARLRPAGAVAGSSGGAAVLNERIWARARAQFDAGLVAETAALTARFDASAPSFSGIGYAEAIGVIEGRLTLEEAIVADARRNAHLARRQATWFRREPDIRWLESTSHSPHAEALERANEYLAAEDHV